MASHSKLLHVYTHIAGPSVPLQILYTGHKIIMCSPNVARFPGTPLHVWEEVRRAPVDIRGVVFPEYDPKLDFDYVHMDADSVIQYILKPLLKEYLHTSASVLLLGDSTTHWPAHYKKKHYTHTVTTLCDTYSTATGTNIWMKSYSGQSFADGFYEQACSGLTSHYRYDVSLVIGGWNDNPKTTRKCVRKVLNHLMWM
jgi:hypothetical protein